MSNDIPEWVARGKSVKQLIEELETFENQDPEVRISIDDGESHHPISIIGKLENHYCVLMNCENSEDE